MAIGAHNKSWFDVKQLNLNYQIGFLKESQLKLLENLFSCFNNLKL
jgi:hypothetical protein